MVNQAEAENSGKELATLPQYVLDQFNQMVIMLPEVESDGGASMITQILNTVDVQELDAPWDTKDPEKLVDLLIHITDARRAPSDFAGGLGQFLVLDAVIAASGEQVTFTTGSVMVVAQVVKAFVLDALPLACVLRKSERPTADGFYPQHLEIEKDQPGRRARA